MSDMKDKNDNNKNKFYPIAKKELLSYVFPYLIVGVSTLFIVLTIIMALSTIGSIGATIVELIVFSVWLVSFSLFCYAFKEDGTIERDFSVEYLKYIFTIYIRSTVVVYAVVILLLIIYLMTKFFGYQLLVL